MNNKFVIPVNFVEPLTNFKVACVIIPPLQQAEINSSDGLDLLLWRFRRLINPDGGYQQETDEVKWALLAAPIQRHRQRGENSNPRVISQARSAGKSFFKRAKRNHLTSAIPNRPVATREKPSDTPC